ncbi:hypothetical protein F2Q68_00008618 [Brassica cretica]|uniref:Uncharacterized protein n=1 Tax=Brassica cretica TaxID=69181 RepID=A0A8S9KPG6_BRACR|nr:hypothetical protein F2Q68_00008618 [Brassica cretica]
MNKTMASSYYSAQIKQCLEHGGRNQSRHLKTIHAHIIIALPSPETILHNKLVHGYAKIRNSTYARQAFDEIPQPNLNSWNSPNLGISLRWNAPSRSFLFVMVSPGTCLFRVTP